MTARRLNRLLTLETAERVADGSGGYTTDWQAVGALWAEVVSGRGTERAGEAVVLASMPYVITVRGAPIGSPRRPRPEQRFRDGTRLFRILAVSEADTGGRWLSCFAKEEVVA